jgi:PASTA domain
MRRLFLRFEVIVVLVVAACLAALAAASEPAASPKLELTAGPGDTLTLANSKEAGAILSLGGMRPGDSVTDTVSLGNTGTIPGDLTLSTSNLVDTPGPGGGALSGKLDLRVRDTTNAGSPVTVYNGKIGAVTPVDLGSLAAGEDRVYEFRVSFPDAGPGAENAHQGSSMSIQFDWTAFNPDDGNDTDPPQTTINSAPPTVTSSSDATFAFSADEPGSTFECALDSGAYAACTTPTSYTGLPAGAHSFSVRATDAAANTDPTPATHAWTIDTTVPGKPSGFSGGNKNGRLVLKWQAASDNLAVGAYLVYANGTLLQTRGASARSADVGVYRVSDGRRFQVAARDTAGNVGKKTRTLVIVPRVAELTVSDARARLAARGLEAGATKYAYSSSVESGRVIRAARSGVVPRGTAVGLTVSRGAQPTTPSSSPTPLPPPPTYTPPPYRPPSPFSPPPNPPTETPPGSTPIPNAQPTPDSSSTPPGGEGSPDPDTVRPESFSPANEEASGLRRLVGLGLLGGAFAAAGAMALRARGSRVKPPVREDAIVEPLLFWDQRLLQTVTSTVRRLTGRA